MTKPRVILRTVALLLVVVSLLGWTTESRATPSAFADLLAERTMQFVQLNVTAWNTWTEQLQHGLGLKTARDYEIERLLAAARRIAESSHIHPQMGYSSRQALIQEAIREALEKQDKCLPP
jgi:hypothetical protein